MFLRLGFWARKSSFSGLGEEGREQVSRRAGIGEQEGVRTAHCRLPTVCRFRLSAFRFRLLRTFPRLSSPTSRPSYYLRSRAIVKIGFGHPAKEGREARDWEQCRKYRYRFRPFGLSLSLSSTVGSRRIMANGGIVFRHERNYL